MTDNSMTPDRPDAAEVAHYLRRFADLISNGQAVDYLQHAAAMLESLTARVIALADEEKLWRYRYATVNEQVDSLEAECGALRHDIEGHLNTSSAIQAERNALAAAAEAAKSELAALSGILERERLSYTIKSASHDEALTALRSAFDLEREELKARILQRDRSLAELRLTTGAEREEFHVTLAAREIELNELRLRTGREYDALRLKAEVMEAESVARQNAVSEQEAKLSQRLEKDAAIGQDSALVPKATLHQARAQFEYLSRQFVSLGDIASQVMCELGAHTMDQALNATGNDAAASDVALSILATADRGGPIQVSSM